MSKKGAEDSKVKFFKIDPDGEVLPEFEDLVELEDPKTGARDLKKSAGTSPSVPNSGEQVPLLQKYISVKEAEIQDFREQKKQLDMLVKKISSELQQAVSKNRELLEELDVVKRREQRLRSELRDT